MKQTRWSPEWSDLRVKVGTGKRLLAQTAAVIVQPGHEFLPGPVTYWLLLSSSLRSHTVFFWPNICSGSLKKIVYGRKAIVFKVFLYFKTKRMFCKREKSEIRGYSSGWSFSSMLLLTLLWRGEQEMAALLAYLVMTWL